MTATTPEVPELKAAIEQRMEELGMSPTDLAAATGLTVQGLLNIRKGKRREYQRRLTGPVCRALGWTPDSIDRILAGGQPRLARTPPASPGVEARLAALEADMEAVASGLRELSEALRDVAEMVHDQSPGRRGSGHASGQRGL